MKIINFIVITSILLCSFVYSQVKYFPLNVDYATFKGSENKTYTEIYFSIFQQDLKYEEEDTVYSAKFSHSISISNKDSIVFESTRHYKNTIFSLQNNLANQFVDVFPIELNPGIYTLNANVIDKTSNKNGEYILELEIPDYTSGFNLSKIEFANKIDSKGDGSNYSLKNNIKILPNVSKTYTVFNPIMYFYFEGYNLTINENGECKYSYNYYISDLEGKRVREYPDKIKVVSSTSIAEATGINVIALKNQPYFLSIELTDLLNNKSTLTKKNFYVNKPKRKNTVEDVTAKIEGFGEYIGFSKEQLINEFKSAKYVAGTEEIDIFEKLTDEQSMKRFLANFWKRRDPNPATPVNEYKIQYFETLKIVNENFSNQFKEGWRTDRGRVILIYGKPNEIERNHSTIDSQPYEIWYYYSLEGGSEFIFADLSGNGNYELLHSTFRNELKDPDWQLRIQKFGTRGYDRF